MNGGVVYVIQVHKFYLMLQSTLVYGWEVPEGGLLKYERSLLPEPYDPGPDSCDGIMEVDEDEVVSNAMDRLRAHGIHLICIEHDHNTRSFMYYVSVLPGNNGGIQSYSKEFLDEMVSTHSHVLRCMEYARLCGVSANTRNAMFYVVNT